MIWITLLTTFLISCKTKIICSQIKSNTIDFIPIYTVKYKFNSCKIQCFDLNNWNTVNDNLCGPDFKGGSFDLEFCENVQGFYLQEMATELRPKIKSLSRLRKDYCKF